MLAGWVCGLLAVVVTPGVVGVDRNNFKTCEQSSFCKRNRRIEVSLPGWLCVCVCVLLVWDCVPKEKREILTAIRPSLLPFPSAKTSIAALVTERLPFA
jgi:hypothetical protein